MRQGFFGLAIGLAIGTALAAGAAFAVGGPGHSVTPRPVAAAPAHVATDTAPVRTPGSSDATGPVRPPAHPVKHPSASAHTPKGGSTHRAHASTAHDTTGHSAPTDGSVSAPMPHRAHVESHDGGACD